MKVGTPPRPNRPKSSAPIVGSTARRCLAEFLHEGRDDPCDQLGVLIVGGVRLADRDVGAGARWPGRGPRHDA